MARIIQDNFGRAFEICQKLSLPISIHWMSSPAVHNYAENSIDINEAEKYT